MLATYGFDELQVEESVKKYNLQEPTPLKRESKIYDSVIRETEQDEESEVVDATPPRNEELSSLNFENIKP